MLLSLATMLFSKCWYCTRNSFTLLAPRTVVYLPVNMLITLVLRAPADFSVFPPMKSFCRLLSSREKRTISDWFAPSWKSDRPRIRWFRNGASCGPS